jgi:2-(1,2-epoxy-1,2-dihydrophenyl)acetyl-CoA isomerase
VQRRSSGSSRPVHGSRSAFCVGGDLVDFAAAGEQSVGPKIKALVANLHKALILFSEMRALLVVAVNGAAAGAGLGLALAGDYVIAADTAQFKMAYSAAGVTPDGGTSYVLPRLVGLRLAQDLIYSNRSLTLQMHFGSDLSIKSSPVRSSQLKSRPFAVRLLAALPRRTVP